MGNLKCNHTGATVPYKIECVVNPITIFKMDETWGRSRNAIITEIFQANPSIQQENNQELFVKKLNEYNLSDAGWKWTAKALNWQGPGYEWLFLVAEEDVQAACLIKHPTKSRLDGSDIFYIDLVASAYWNRNRPGYSKKYSGTGTILIQHAITYMQDKFGYRPGFCLHSLPTIEDYYQNHLKMTQFEADPEKENLKYFEASPDVACNIAEGK